jgi:23S rRNA pseudouridine955/2504/2580 synthase
VDKVANSSDSDAKVQYLTVDENAEGQRIDNFLMARLKGVPKSWVYRVLRKGEVRVNKGRAKPTRKLEIGDEVRVPPVRRSDDKALTPGTGMQQAITDNILYEDDLLLIVNKPSGMAVHGGSGVSHGVIEALRAARPEAKFLELAL